MATGNISKQKGFTGQRGATGPKGDKGDTGDFSNVRLNYNEETGDLSYQTELVPSTTTAPYIGKNGNWYIFDGVSKKYVDSGVNAQGGVSDEFVKEYLDKKTAVLKSDIEGLQKRINEEAHFRGYLSTNAKIQALTATPNDFAYSAESNTKWVYDAEKGWQNTGVAVPDQLTPASETTPLINGEASVGEEEAYARGDHRHPTDTTRASVEALNDLRDYTQTELAKVETFLVNVTVTNIVGVSEYSADKTYEEILDAHNEGKHILAKLSGGNAVYEYHLSAVEYGYLYFTMIYWATLPQANELVCDPDGNWRRQINRLITRDDRTTQISLNNEDNITDYTTPKAVVDYVKTAKEDIEDYINETFLGGAW